MGDTVEVPSGGAANTWYFDESSTTIESNLVVDVTKPESSKDIEYQLGYLTGETTLTNQYNSASNGGKPWVAGYRGCCRLDASPHGDPTGDLSADDSPAKLPGLNNNGGMSFNIRTVVDLSGGPLQPAKDKSPVAVGGKPLLRLTMDTLHSFDVVVLDPDSDELTWRLGGASEMGDFKLGNYYGKSNKQPGYGNNKLRDGSSMSADHQFKIANVYEDTVSANTGVVTWDTRGLHTGYWQATIMVNGGTSSIPYDFLLLLVDPCKGVTDPTKEDCNDAPEWDNPTPAPLKALSVVCDKDPLVYTLRAFDKQTTELVEIKLVSTAPLGVSHAESVGIGAGGVKNPVQQVVTWLPRCNQKGRHIVCYEATDNNPKQTLDSRMRCIHIEVKEIVNNAPTFCGVTAAAEHRFALCWYQTLTFTVEVCDINKEDTLSIEFRSGVPTGATVATQSGSKTMVSRTFSWKPTVASLWKDHTVCYEGVDHPPASTGFASKTTGIRCVYLVARYAPRFVNPTPMRKDGGNYRYNAKVCDEISFAVTASDQNSDVDEDVTIFVLADPGLPNGAVVGDNVCPPPSVVGTVTTKVRCNPVSRTFSWTPAKTQEGKVYKVCFSARDNKNNCQYGGYYSEASDNPCVEVYVVPPMPVWQATTPAQDAALNAYVGCTHKHTVKCADAQTTVAAYSMQVGFTSANPGPRGSSLSACPESGVCSKDFTWKPSRGQEGATYKVCYDCSDLGCNKVLHDFNNQRSLAPMVSASQRCVHLNVMRCRYCAQEGDTLAYITKYYHLNTNWLRLWNSNGKEMGDSSKSMIGNPDTILPSSTVLNVGPIYKVQAGDTLQALASRFRTTVKKLMSVNPDVGSVGTDLQAGQELCVMPCTDVQNSKLMTYKYSF